MTTTVLILGVLLVLASLVSDKLSGGGFEVSLIKEKRERMFARFLGLALIVGSALPWLISTVRSLSTLPSTEPNNSSSQQATPTDKIQRSAGAPTNPAVPVATHISLSEKAKPSAHTPAPHSLPQRDPEQDKKLILDMVKKYRQSHPGSEPEDAQKWVNEELIKENRTFQFHFNAEGLAGYKAGSGPCLSARTAINGLHATNTTVGIQTEGDPCLTVNDPTFDHVGTAVIAKH